MTPDRSGNGRVHGAQAKWCALSRSRTGASCLFSSCWVRRSLQESRPWCVSSSSRSQSCCSITGSVHSTFRTKRSARLGSVAGAMPPFGPGDADNPNPDSQQAGSDRTFRQGDDSDHCGGSAGNQDRGRQGKATALAVVGPHPPPQLLEHVRKRIPRLGQCSGLTPGSRPCGVVLAVR